MDDMANLLCLSRLTLSDQIAQLNERINELNTQREALIKQYTEISFNLWDTITDELEEYDAFDEMR